MGEIINFTKAKEDIILDKNKELNFEEDDEWITFEIGEEGVERVKKAIKHFLSFVVRSIDEQNTYEYLLACYSPYYAKYLQTEDEKAAYNEILKLLATFVYNCVDEFNNMLDW